MRPRARIVIVLVVLAVASWFGAAWSFDTGLTALRNFAGLPASRIPALPRQESSHDRTGGNDDGFFGTYSFLYRDAANRYVIVDETGAGCVERMWFTDLSTSGNLVIFADNETTPVVDRPIAQVVAGTNAPFLFPLAGNDDASSGGFYSYVPICFRERLIMATTGLPHFYHVTMERFADDTGVTPFDPDVDVADLVALWNEPGLSPGGASDVFEASGTATAASGASASLLETTGAGIVVSVHFKPVSPVSEAWRTARLVIRFDDADEPQVDAPVADFFLAADAQIDARSLPVGIDGEGWWYVYFPMPYWRNVSVEMVNDGDETVETEYVIDVAPHASEIHDGHFHATANAASTSFGEDYVYLETGGRGHYVGGVVTMTGIPTRYFLEGDERVYVNGAASPALYGTGTEDYFNGGWYFNRGLFTLPTHGYHGHANDVLSDTTSCYRMHFADPIPFMDGIRFGIEHDFFNFIPGEDYRNVAFWYGAPDAALVQRAFIDVGDEGSEAESSYAAPDSENVSVNSAFEGDFDTVMSEDTGRRIGLHSRFIVPLPRVNDGVLLRRLTDAAAEGACAKVYVDDVEVGVWRRRGMNTHKRWLEDDFVVPAEFTTGKRSIAVRVEPLPGSAWTEFAWTAFSIHRPLPSRLSSLTLDWTFGPPGEPGVTTELTATGTYWNGEAESFNGVVEWLVEGPEHTMDDGDFTPMACGPYTIRARAGDATSNVLYWSTCGLESDDDAGPTPTPPVEEEDSEEDDERIHSECCGV